MLQRISMLIKRQSGDPTIGGLLAAMGDTVPANGTQGFQTGAVFQKLNGGARTALYVNEGTEASCAFVAVSTLTDGVTAGTASSSKSVVLNADKSVQGLGLVGADVFKGSLATVAALGANQATAAPLTADNNIVTGGDATVGVSLPAVAFGRRVFIKNSSAGGLKVYPAAGGGKVNALAANAAISMGSQTSAIFVGADTINWVTCPLLPS